MANWDPLYIAFLYHFNIDRDYFECHEVMEELWLEEGRDARYQGLLQIAVGLYHHRNGNPSGSVKLFSAGIAKLQGVDEAPFGIRLHKLVLEAAEYVEKLERLAEEPFDFYDLNIEITDPTLRAAVEQYDPKHGERSV